MGKERRYLIFGFIAGALLLNLILSELFSWAVFQFKIPDPSVVSDRLSLSGIISVTISLATTIVCWRNSRVNTLGTEVVEELAKVVWPTKDETSYATIVVAVSVIIFSIILGAFDAIWQFVTNKIY